ncbi:MAG: DNA-binding protein Alba [DPANN group archaeon]|nr:DNA-binding protein Alba [DPANN group archaeon]
MTETTTDNRGIYIGDKPLMSYVTAAVMQLTSQNSNKLAIKGRGKFISKAVDVAEVVRERFLKDKVNLDDIRIGSGEFTNREGKQVRVSTIEIDLVRKA